MNTTERRIGDIRIIELEGRFDAFTLGSAKKWMDDMVADPPANGVINMQGVNFIDSTALAVLVRGMKGCREKGGDLHLCCLQRATRIIFELTRFDKAFLICDSEDEAVAAFGSPEPLSELAVTLAV